MNKLPKLLRDCPLIDALIEIRFETTLNPSVVFAVVYALLREEFKGPVINLPLLQIPEQVRLLDPNLKYKPLYRIDGDGIILQIGPDVICVSSQKPYVGWDRLSGVCVNIINKMISGGVITGVTRLGHRYVNFFEKNITEELAVTFGVLDGYELRGKLIRYDLVDGNFTNVMQFSDTAEYKMPLSGQIQRGSLIDIDTSRDYGFDKKFFINHMREELDLSHMSEKKLFYAMLKERFIQSLNPEYDE